MVPAKNLRGFNNPVSGMRSDQNGYELYRFPSLKRPLKTTSRFMFLPVTIAASKYTFLSLCNAFVKQIVDLMF